MSEPTIARKRPTSKDVAALAGVAQSTVSHVINGNYPVSDAARRQVLAAMEQLDYHPNTSARTLRTSRTHVIALLENMGENSAGYDVLPYLSGIIRHAREYDYDVIVNTLSEDATAIDRLAQRMICDGFIIMDVVENDPRIARAARTTVPSVFVGRIGADPDAGEPAAGESGAGKSGENANTDSVYFNYDRAMEEIARQAADDEYDAMIILHSKPSPGIPVSPLERTMYRSGFDAAQRYGLHAFIADTAAIDGQHDGNENADGKRVLETLRSGRCLIAVRRAEDADLVRRWCLSHGLTPGRDLSIVAVCPDVAIKQFPELSYMSNRADTVVATAVNTLMRRINGDDSGPHNIAIAPERIIHRATTIPPQPGQSA